MLSALLAFSEKLGSDRIRHDETQGRKRPSDPGVFDTTRMSSCTRDRSFAKALIIGSGRVDALRHKGKRLDLSGVGGLNHGR